MTSRLDAERVLDAFLAPASDRLADRVLDDAFSEIARTPQRRALRVPWRFPQMPALSRATAVSVVAVATLLVAGGTVYLVGSRHPDSSATPAPPTPRVTPATPSKNPFTDPAKFSLTVGPGVSADGTIVFGLHDDATDADTLYALDPNGSQAWQIAEAGSCCITLAPDGRAAIIGSDLGTRIAPMIVKLPVGGSYDEDWSNFAPNFSLSPAAWSSAYDVAMQGWSDADASKTGIYLSVHNGGGLVAGNLVRLTNHPGKQMDLPLAFSPDGSKLLFVREAPNNEAIGDLFVIGVDGKGLRKLSPDGVGVMATDVFGPGASWSPDSRQVAFAASDVDGAKYSPTSRAYVVDAAGGDPVVITPSGRYMTSARWSPDGAWIAYDLDNQGKDLWLVRPDGTDAHRITYTSGSCCGTWSPDSKYLLFEGNDTQGAGLFIANADGSGYSRLLTLKTEYDTHWRGWNPEPDRTP